MIYYIIRINFVTSLKFLNSNLVKGHGFPWFRNLEMALSVSFKLTKALHVLRVVSLPIVTFLLSGDLERRSII